jgi:hypothetical protein
MMGQSSRIFPLGGLVREGTINYRFDRGVTAGCSTGCYCRINSTTRREWCRYRAQVLQQGTEQRCLNEYSTTQFTDAWAQHAEVRAMYDWDDVAARVERVYDKAAGTETGDDRSSVITTLTHPAISCQRCATRRWGWRRC